MFVKMRLKSNKDIHLSLPEKAITFQLFFILFERFFVQLGAPNSIIYILDIVNIYLLLNIILHRKNIKFGLLILIYMVLVCGSVFIALANFSIYGNNVLFTILEVRNIVRFLIFFLASVYFFKVDYVEKIYSIFEMHFWVNSVFIIYQYFTYFPPTASWMRGDLLNGFFGNIRGGNTFVNIEMLIVVLYLFVKWTEKEEKLMHLLAALGMSFVVAGLIELKAFFIEIVFVYIWYLVFVKKSKREKQLNVVIIVAALLFAWIAMQIMIKEYPWFANIFTLKGILDALTSEGYSSVDGLNRFTGFFIISERMFSGNITEILFGIGLGNGAVSEIAGKTTTFASMYSNSNYSWFQGTYLFVQCGFIGLVLYISTFVILFKRNKRNQFKTFSNMIILLSVFLVFYGETLKTDAGYLMYFSIATGFMMLKKKRKLREVKI